MMKKSTLRSLIVLLAITILFCLPYIIKSGLAIEHDTFFHLSRIENYSVSIKNLDLLPSVYPYENAGFGYGSPLFYSDILLFIPSLLHLLGLPLIFTYKLTIFILTFLAALFMYLLVHRVTKNEYVGYLGAIAYTFNNYHITDVYVRSALGEVMAISFLPLFILSIYYLFYEKEENKWPLLYLSLSLLVLSHNITFIFAVVLFIILFIINISKLNKEVFKYTFLAVLLAFLSTTFYTLPLIEQLTSQKFMVNIYQSYSSLDSYSIDAWQYFANKTIFAVAGNFLERDQTMLVNIGYFLTFIPLLYLFIDKEDKNRFFTSSLIIGYIFLLLPSSFIPWKEMTFLSTIQFPWRLNTISSLLLTPVSVYSLYKLLKKDSLLIIISLILCLEGMYHILPATYRTFMMPSNMTWQEVRDGKMCDPYYSADYMRVELAGGEYLPMNHVDFRDYPYAIRDRYNEIVDVSIRQNYTELDVYFPVEVGNTYTLPLTYYKGYQVYDEDNNRLETFKTSNGFVGFEANFHKNYKCRYEVTTLKQTSIIASLLSIILTIYLSTKKGLK